MFVLPELDYTYDSLDKCFSKEIIELHHGKHHQIYVDKLNGVMESLPEFNGKTVEELISDLSNIPDQYKNAVKNFGGGHYNHSLFWKFISPSGGGEPNDKLAEELNKKYGSFQSFKDEFTKQALGVFGSGWVWLQPDLSIITTANQDSPLNNGLPAPIMGIDVWEHAYYLDYKYNRADYIAAWWNITNWDEASKRFNDAV